MGVPPPPPHPPPRAGRWSFSYPDADFRGASVAVKCGTATLPLTKLPLLPNLDDPRDATRVYGERSLTWDITKVGSTTLVDALDAQGINLLSRWPKPPPTDLACTVTVKGFKVGGARQPDVSYKVTIFDPAA